MDLSWMAWSVPTAVFFAAIVTLLAVMGVLGIVAPSPPRRGWLGLRTERGDRLFVALLATAYIHLAWLAVTDAPLWIASLSALVVAALTLRYA